MADQQNRKSKTSRKASLDSVRPKKPPRDDEYAQQPPPPTPPSLPVSEYPTARALHAYTAESADELDFKKDDVLDIISDLSKGWWYARRHRGNKLGYVPSNYVLLNNAEVTQQPGWMEITRSEADKLLLQPGLPEGLFVLRPCSVGCYSISLRVKHPTKPNFYSVQHYRMSITSAGLFCISPEATFHSVGELLAHYAQTADGMACKLMKPFPQPPPPPPADLSQLEVNRDCFVMLEVIGHGSFSEVHQAKFNNSIFVAVKTLKPNMEAEQNFIQEARLLLKAHHPHVLQIMGVCTDREPLYIVTELMTNGSLLNYLRKDKGVLLNIEHLLLMKMQLVEAMSHLESLRIVHRDLRAANVLVGEDARVKLADFGLARELDDAGVYTGQGEKFPAKWTPSEAVTKGRFTAKSDVWSFGVVMWEIVTYGGVPYQGLQNREAVELVSKGYRMPNPHGGHIRCDPSLYQIMLDCWSASPEKRPTFAKLKDQLKAYAAEKHRASRRRV
ncbi:hypothetical protein BOX15_Mlig030404g4 [Macrostomum lignano]|uniref:Tyrosine-protein kinase n=1 Tax=Macrostomum lignano TaxID=282301 RepID=A0A267DBU7_9PLAT|nr:hypothetical protein BOX15_Mlig030404g4 [Macrostomum lignano]